MADKNNANIGFEKQIWDAACILWDGSVICLMLFLVS